MTADELHKVSSLLLRVKMSDIDILDREALMLLVKAYDWMSDIAREYAASKHKEITRSHLLPEGAQIITLQSLERKK